MQLIVAATVSPTNVFNALRGLFSPVKRLPAQPENVLPVNRHGDQEHDDEDQDDDRQHDRQQQDTQHQDNQPNNQQDDQLQDQQQDEQQHDEQQDGQQDAQVLIGDQIIPIVPIIPEVAQDDNEDDSVNFSMAASLLPPPFHGNYGSDPQNWIETVKWYILTQRAPTEKSKIAIVGVLLQGEAHRWFLSLDIRDPAPDPAPEGFVAYPQDTITNFEQFRVRFLDRFRRDQAELWREQSMLMNLKQRPGQKTEDLSRGTSASSNER